MDALSEATRLKLTRVRHTIHRARRMDMTQPPVGNDELRNAEETLDAILAPDPPETHPFVKGERVYILWPPLCQPEGTVCDNGYVLNDDGDYVLVNVVHGPVLRVAARLVRRDRRGKQGPVYAERPLTAEERAAH